MGRIEGEWLTTIPRKDLIAMLRKSYGNGARKMQEVVVQELDRMGAMYLDIESAKKLVLDIEIVEVGDEEAITTEIAG